VSATTAATIERAGALASKVGEPVFIKSALGLIGTRVALYRWVIVPSFGRSQNTIDVAEKIPVRMLGLE
jgi:hypothetical protein